MFLTCSLMNSPNHGSKSLGVVPGGKNPSPSASELPGLLLQFIFQQLVMFLLEKLECPCPLTGLHQQDTAV